MYYAAQSAKFNKLIFEGDENAAILPIGQVIGGIHDIPTCRELIERTSAQAEAILKSKVWVEDIKG
jgi:NAD(P)H-dependent flavin oxidoreductase YrpB (nitropropane dioxygenase family)